MINWLFLVLAILLGYFIGSIPSALIIGKKYYHVDVRDYGSHNLGGTNAGRVLGRKAGAIVISLDIFKILLCLIIIYLLYVYIFNVELYPYFYLAGIFAIIGHCYPIYAGFRGGKAMSTAAGLLLSTNWMILIIAGLIYLIVLKKSKMVSLSGLIASASATILAFIPVFGFAMQYELPQNIWYGITILLATSIIFIRHISNIKRIINKEESKIKWLK